MRASIVMALAASMAATGCAFTTTIAGIGGVQGSGVTKRESREVTDFHGVDVSGAFEVTVTVGPARSVVIEADDNLLPLITADVVDGHLAVAVARGNSIRTGKPIKLTVVTPKLDFVRVRGSSKVEATVTSTPALKIHAEGASTAAIRGIDSASVEASASGSSRISLAGSGRDLDASASGASKVEAGEAAFETADVDASGASQIRISASGSVEGGATGASKIRVLGGPKVRKVMTSGASTVDY